MPTAVVTINGHHDHCPAPARIETRHHAGSGNRNATLRWGIFIKPLPKTFTMSDISQSLRKRLRALRQMALRGDTEHERDTAEKLMLSLMQKYDLTEIDLITRKVVEHRFPTFSDPWKESIAMNCAVSLGLVVYRYKGGRRSFFECTADIALIFLLKSAYYTKIYEAQLNIYKKTIAVAIVEKYHLDDNTTPRKGGIVKVNTALLNAISNNIKDPPYHDKGEIESINHHLIDM